MQYNLLALVILSLVWLSVVAGDLPFPDEEPEERALQVNEGELHFLSEPPRQVVHHHSNRILITASSLDQGWVVLEQCHSHLDAVPATEVVYRPERVRALRIIAATNIGKSWVEGASVQLRDVGPQAGVCISAESRALNALAGGGYRLRNGPYMRRFLDGYYPMRVSLDIRYPDDLIRWVASAPPDQAGFRIDAVPGRIQADAWFEGKLFTRFDFCRRDDANCPLEQPAVAPQDGQN
jgi:hypothetical protein